MWDDDIRAVKSFLEGKTIVHVDVNEDYPWGIRLYFSQDFSESVLLESHNAGSVDVEYANKGKTVRVNL